jgi:hypothetical protein
LAFRLLLVPIGVGVGIGIGIDSDVYCGWSSRTETIGPADILDRCTVHIQFLEPKSHLLSFDSDSDTDPDPDYNPYRDRDGFIENISKPQAHQSQGRYAFSYLSRCALRLGNVSCHSYSARMETSISRTAVSIPTSTERAMML